MPPTTCAVCNSDFRAKLEAMNAEGISLRKQSTWLEERGVTISHSAIKAHMDKHLGRPYVAKPGEDALKLMDAYIDRLEQRILNLEAHMLDVVSTNVACEYNEYTESSVNRVRIDQQDVFIANVGSPETLKQDRQNLTNAFVAKTEVERGSPCTNRDEFNERRISRLKAEYAKEDEGKEEEEEDPRISQNIQEYMQAGGGDGIAL